MKISAEQFAELAATFDAKQSSSHHERRCAARLDLQARVKIRPVMSGQRLSPMYVMVSNFSSRGLSFVHTQTMEQGRQFITELPRKSGGIVELLCTVVHTQSVGNNAWRIGAEFTCQIPASAEPHTVAGDNAEMKRISESMMK